MSAALNVVVIPAGDDNEVVIQSARPLPSAAYPVVGEIATLAANLTVSLRKKPETKS